MAKKIKANLETERSENSKNNQLKSINKKEKKKLKSNNKKDKSKKDKESKNIDKNKEAVQLNKKQQSVEKNKNQSVVIVKNSNQKNDSNGKKKNRRKRKHNNNRKKSAQIVGIVNSKITNDSRKNNLQQNGEQNKAKNSKTKESIVKDSVKPAVGNKKQNGSKNVVQNKKKTLKRLDVKKTGNIILKNKKNYQKPPSSLSLRDRMMAQLKASRFRFLNEQMYNSESTQSKKFFQDDPQAFYAYHEGYKHQVERWPLNPLDVIIDSIEKMPNECVIADFGCGEAKLANSVSQTVHSFDLVAVNDKVKACDMAYTPLLTGRINVVVFCLSLMGSNLGDYLLEANRVLEKNGILKIAEVESRFEQIDNFINDMAKYGFVITWKDLSHNLFYFMDFKKTKDVLKKDSKKLPVIRLKSCLYKKR